MFETKTDSSMLHAVFANDTTQIKAAVKKDVATVKATLNQAAREEAQFQKRPDDFAMRK